MKQVDYIIVGCGLAGIAFCEQLRKHNKSFLVFDDSSQCSSKVAGGLYNPVTLKRFTPTWQAERLLKFIQPYYSELEYYLQVKLNYQLPVLRAFNAIEEQNNWFVASDKPLLSRFLSTDIVQNNNVNIRADFGLGKVLETGRIDTQLLIDTYTEKLISEEKLIQESFQYNAIDITSDGIVYNAIKAKHIVFSEGFGLKQNPYFENLPLRGSKGEYIKIKAPELKLDFALKGSIFVIPLKNQEYLVGATYDNEDKTSQPTNTKKEELTRKLKNMISCDFEIIDHLAGLRPTVKDRRPLVGEHPEFNNLFVLNGLGTRGVMASPYVAEQLYNAIENNVELDPEIAIKRFTS